jgi:hypothetical protein
MRQARTRQLLARALRAVSRATSFHGSFTPAAFSVCCGSAGAGVSCRRSARRRHVVRLQRPRGGADARSARQLPAASPNAEAHACAKSGDGRTSSKAPMKTPNAPPSKPPVDTRVAARA